MCWEWETDRQTEKHRDKLTDPAVETKVKKKRECLKRKDRKIDWFKKKRYPHKWWNPILSRFYFLKTAHFVTWNSSYRKYSEKILSDCFLNSSFYTVLLLHIGHTFLFYCQGLHLHNSFYIYIYIYIYIYVLPYPCRVELFSEGSKWLPLA